MIDQRDDRLDPATSYGFPRADRDVWRSSASPVETVSPPVEMFTAYEWTLTWCVLTLLSARGAPFSGRATPPDGRPLTMREREVLGLVALGLTNAQIAARLFLSRRTIDQHLSSIYNRLGVSSRAAATRFAILNDLC